MITPADLTADLANARALLREHGGPFAGDADVTLSGLDELARWILRCAEASRAGDYVVAAPDDSPVDTLYIWLNEIDINPGRWFLVPFAFSLAGSHGRDIEVSEFFDGLVGHEVADLFHESFTLTGTESLQASFARHGAGASPRQRAIATDIVVTGLFDLVDRALRSVGDVGLRVAVSMSEEQRIALWVFEPVSGWSCQVHGESWATLWPSG